MKTSIKRFNPFSFAKRIYRPLILDGSMGALIDKKGMAEDSFFWSAIANEKFPEKIISLHRDYIVAGADIVTTNTFRTNPTALKKSGRKVSSRYAKKAAELAKLSIKDDSVMIAGSNAPAEDCYQSGRTLSKKEIEENHSIHITQLMESGCDFVLNETHSHLDEIKFISNYCSSNKIPFIISFLFDEKLKLLDGNKLTQALDYVLGKNPLAIGFNCITDKILLGAVRKIKPDFNWGFYLNCSKGFITERIYSGGLSVKKYQNVVIEALPYSPSFIGACCGSSPVFIKQIKRILDGTISS